MLSSVLIGKINTAKEHSGKINNYFIYSPDVFEKVKIYEPKKILKFLNKIIINWRNNGNSRRNQKSY